MEYHESAEYLRSLRRHRPKLGVETTARMLSHLGDPQSGYDCVQVAGSNGKGSTARMLECVLRAAGLHVGLFTSPRLHDLREQVRVDGRKVPRSQLATYVEEIQPCIDRLAADDDEPTHFEVLTALALHHFGVEDVDVAVLEVGIGGRYDSTSAVDPVASAVTSVSLEHTDLLGDTVEEIARDKAQVAPGDRPLVTGATDAALAAIHAETETVTVGATDADVLAVETGMGDDGRSHVSLNGHDWAVETRLPLLGQHQAVNAGVAATLARQVADVEASTIANGLKSVTWPGRFEVVARDPTVVLDGSHNPGAAATLQNLVGRYDYDDLHVVFGAMSDKDHAWMVESYPPIDRAFLTRPNNDRAEAPETLAGVFEGHAGSVERIESVAEATERAIDAAGDGDFVLVTGSLYTVAEARDRWMRVVVPKSRGGDIDDGAFTGAWFPDSSTADLDHRVLSMYLRPDQSAKVADRIRAVGGECRRSAAGAPGEFEVTVVSGTVPKLRALADTIATDGLGLDHVATQLRGVLQGPPEGDALDTDGTAVMGILNVTPDSFYDGGRYETVNAAVERAEAMVAAGADVVDVGGESTRPGAQPVPVEEEKDRVVPVIEALSDIDVPLSVDTRKAAVADAALAAGADIVNDVSGLADPEMRYVVADHDASLVLMHSVSTPVDPDSKTTYDDVVADVIAELNEQVLLAEQAGIDRDRIIVDPGCGFGKDARESFELVSRLAEFDALGCPVMVGHSRKSMFERVGCESGDRLSPTLAVTAMAAERGADVVRVHDVAENARVLRTVDATTDP